MAVRAVNLFGHEVAAALRKKLRLVVRPVMPSVKGCKVGTYTTQTPNGLHVEPVNVQENGDPWDDISCPFGVPGTRLVGKESWAMVPARDYDGPESKTCPGGYGVAVYREGFAAGQRLMRWTAPTAMPVWASRIMLVSETVRICRLGDLTVEDIMACGYATTLREHEAACHLREQFYADWDAQYAKKVLGYNKSRGMHTPWVWKVAVKGVEQ